MEVDKSRLVFELTLRDHILAAADRHSQATYQRDTPWFLLASSWFHAWQAFLQSQSLVRSPTLVRSSSVHCSLKTRRRSNSRAQTTLST